jgi:sugar phosphate isomerase/epimerase
MTPAQDLSIQLYSMRFYGDLDQQLDALAVIGFRRVETVGSHLAEAKATRAKLDARGLTAPSGHVAMADLRRRFDWVIDQARTLGITDLFMPAVPVEDRAMPLEGWRALGAELGNLAERARDHGVRLGYHNHDWELHHPVDGLTPLAALFEAADGSPLTWQADLAWLVRGGVDPLLWLKRYADRLASVHVKDIAPAGQNLDEDGWCEVGRGTLDWRKLWGASLEAGARHLVLEHDKPKDAVAFARNSRAFVLGIAG